MFCCWNLLPNLNDLDEIEDIEDIEDQKERQTKDLGKSTTRRQSTKFDAIESIPVGNYHPVEELQTLASKKSVVKHHQMQNRKINSRKEGLKNYHVQTDLIKQAFKPEAIFNTNVLLKDPDDIPQDIIKAHQGPASFEQVEEWLKEVTSAEFVYCSGTCFGFLGEKLLDPGPAYCLAGKVEFVQQGDVSSIQFFLPPGKCRQYVRYNKDAKQYEQLQWAYFLDSKNLQVYLDINEAMVNISTRPLIPEICLN